MSGKRQATSDLNHNNWDQEEEPEDPGRFKEANEEELKTRVIKKARRRITDATTADASGTKSIFGGFTGFTKTTNTSAESTNTPSLFSFLNKTPAATSSSSNTINKTQNTTKTTTATPANTKTTGFSFDTFKNVDAKPKNDKDESAKYEAYFSKIIKLNQSFCQWIKEHVDKQPLCNLMSTFKDYEKYWEQINKEKSLTNVATPAAASVSSTTTTTTNSSSVFGNIKFNAQNTGFGTSIKNETLEKSENDFQKTNGLAHANEKANGSSIGTSSQFSFGVAKSNDEKANNKETNVITPFTFSSPNSKPKTETPSSSSLTFGVKAVDKATTSPASASNTSGFSFGVKKDEPSTTATPFSFGVKKDEKLASTGFSFTPGGVPFSFGNIKPPTANVDTKDTADDEDENEDEPPKVEIKEIVEDDAIFTKKCKVFVKKDNAYKDFGIGTLYLKSVKDTTKIQLLVRSSNNLGTILINLLLVEGSVVTQRVGKNNVMIVHPNAEGETQTTLVRVKDGAEADALLEEINKHKK